MTLAAGTRLGPYEIVAPIGAGGMGEVFKARDTRLDRSVAIKVLPAELAQDEQFRIRFEREAKTISQLNHPNICALYDVGEAEIADARPGGAPLHRLSYLVMELLEGETLADRIARGPLPLDDVLKFGRQIAEALDKAHRSRVTHRDLKPGNIMLTKSGAKLLDFGLAKATTQAADIEGPTQHKPITMEGTILGTFQYMAPEQLDGEEADARADIFALGCVLYEMATGKRAFEGKTRSSLIAAIATGQPRPLSEIQPLTPPMFEHVVTKCLEKDPEERWQSAHDVAEELRWTGTSQTSSPGQGRGPSRRAFGALLLLLMLAIAAALYFAFRRTETPALEASINTDENYGLDYFSGPPAFSPDGLTIAYSAHSASGSRMIWLRRLNNLGTQSVAGTSGGTNPFWSADGKYIAFFADGQLKKTPVTGGETEVLAVARPTSGGSWNADGVILFSGADGSRIHRISAAGGDAVPVIASSLKQGAQRWPWFLPDGKHFLYLALPARGERGSAAVFLASLDGKEPPRFIITSDANATYVDGSLLFGQKGALRSQRFDASSGKLSGEPITVGKVQTMSWSSAGMYGVSNRGLLVYQPPGKIDLSQLTARSRDGQSLRTFGEPAYYWSPSLSHDGAFVAVDKSDDETGSGDIWIFGSDGRSPTRMTFENENDTRPIWSPDDREVGYGHFKEGTVIAMRKSLAGGTAHPFMPEVSYSVLASDWSLDGYLLACVRFSTSSYDTTVYSIREKKFIDVAASAANESAPQFSPDGKWIVYQSDDSGRNEVYVQPFPPTGAKYQISNGGGKGARWRKPAEIIYLAAEDRLTSVAVETTPQFRTATPEVLFRTQLREDPGVSQFDVAPDGSILLNEIVQRQSRPMNLLVDWTRRFEQVK